MPEALDDLNDACLDEWGEPATLFPGAPEAREIQVIYDEKWTESDPETGIGISSTAPRIRARVSDLGGVEAGDRIRVRGKAWELGDLQPDGHGMIMGVLSR